MGRIAVVGCEASGKTVFLSALTDLYRPNGEDPSARCLLPENKAANQFAALQHRQMRLLRQWPAATNPDKAVRLEWTLRSGGRTQDTVSLLEFGGETFRAAFRESEDTPEHQHAVKELLDYLARADSVILLVSLKDLLREPDAQATDRFERDTEAVWVTRGLLEFVRTRLPRANLVIGLTQADRFGAELAAAGGPAALLSARWPAVGVRAQGLDVVAVASVSGTDAEGRPAQGYTTDGIRPVLDALARQRRRRWRRPVLLALLVLAGAAGIASHLLVNGGPMLAWPETEPPPAAKESPAPEPPAPPRPVTVTNVVFEAVAVTNTVTEVVTVTNTVTETVTVTNEVPAAAARSAHESAQARRQRIFDKCWHDAEAGDAKAKRILAGHYMNGSEFVTQNVALAQRLYREAAELGDAKAMYRVGTTFYEAMPNDPLARGRAHDWFQKAKAAGCPAADLDDLIEQTR